MDKAMKTPYNIKTNFRKSTIPVLLLSVLVFWGCKSTEYPADVDYGSRLVYVPEGPEFVLGTYAMYNDDGEGKLVSTVDLTVNSLIFATVDTVYQASIEMMYILYRTDETGSPVTWLQHTASRDFPAEGRGTELYFNRERITKTFDIEPGEYELHVTITDVATGKHFSRSTASVLPDMGDDGIQLSDISIFSGDGRSAYIIGTYDVPAFADSLSFRFFATRNEGSEPFFLHMRLVRFESDLAPAGRMHDINATRGSLRTRGILYGNRETVEHQVRGFIDETGPIDMDFTVPMPGYGAYRFEAYITKKENESPSASTVFKARDFSVRSANFPDIVSAFEFAEPLHYLMNERDHRALMQIEDPDSLRRATELFWVESLGSTDLARQLMAEYYTRVVEANLQFTGFKEGWKTDMGMMFILFGAPWYIDRGSNTITWIYGYDRADFNRVFTFRQTRYGNERNPFSYWVLQRHPSYYSIEYQRRQEWLRGYVLQRRFP